MNLVQIQDYRVNRKVVMAVSRDETTDSLTQEVSNGEAGIVEKKPRRTSKRASARTRKKAPESSDEETSDNDSVRDEETVGSSEVLKKPRTRTRKKGLIFSKLDVV